MSGIVGKTRETVGGLLGRRARWQMEGKVVVVTGAGSGIGRERARPPGAARDWR